MATTTTTTDAREELRKALSRVEPGLAPLADVAFDLHLEGFSDPDQIVLELEFHPIFQQYFAGIRDDQGRLRMSPSAYTQFDRSVKQTLAAYGLDHLYSRQFVAGLVASERSVPEVQQDLQTFHKLKRNPTLRRDFFAYTGIDPGDEGVFALALGLAPDLERAYNQAVQGGVSAEQFVQRRIAFETQLLQQDQLIAGQETELDRINARIVGVDERISPLNNKLAELVQQLKEKDKTTGEYILKGNRRANARQKIADIRERITKLRAHRNVLVADRVTQQGLIAGSQQGRIGIEAELQTHLSTNVPDLTPDYSSEDPLLDRLEAQTAFERALSHEKGRFTTGGAGQVDTNQLRRTF